ncbi:MAG TPA: hypothetical protein VII84_04895 [Acidimicrobiales bacterium]
MAARRAEGYTEGLCTRSLAPLLRYLRSIVDVPPPPSAPTTPIDDWLAEFGRYLREERGLAASTITNYVSLARLFLAEHFNVLDTLSVRHVLEFVAEQCRRYDPAFVTVGLRAFLRYGHRANLMPGSLAEAVPSVASWRLSSLPQFIEPVSVQAMLASCDQSTAFGRRDFAIILRHHKLSTTAIYAKVDRRTLLAVAQAWPSAS